MEKLNGTVASHGARREAAGGMLLGEQDTDDHDPTLRNSSGAKRQGRNRLERGHAFYATARHEAANLGVTLNWRLETVPDAAHSDALMMPAAARALLANFLAGETRGARHENRPSKPSPRS